MTLSPKRLLELANAKSIGAFYELCQEYKLNPSKTLKEVMKYKESLKTN